MKNAAPLLMCCLILCSLFSNAHENKSIIPYLNSSSVSHGNNVMNLLTPFFTEDFSGGFPAGWRATDSSGHGVNWHYTTTGTNNNFYDSLSVTGTTAANGYMIYDSDSANHSVGGENADLVSRVINCSNHPNVHLVFNEYLIYYNDTATVLVSNNGRTWTEFHNSSAGLAQYEATVNPHKVDLDISSVAANNDSVYIRFNYRADYSYFWMIDDVQLYESPTIEGSLIGITSPVTGCNLLSSTEPFTVDVYNNGGDSIMRGFDLSYVIDNSAPVVEHVTDTIVPGTSLHYTFQSTADLSVPGNHVLSATLVLPGDTIASNDSVGSIIHIGPYPVNTNSVYVNGFELSDDLSGYTTEDNNGDSISWHVSNLFPYAGNYCAQLSSVTADDWYFTTCLDFDSTIIYRIKYFYRATSSATSARFHVLIGTTPSSAGVTEEIVPISVVNNIFYLPASTQFTVLNSGTYYVGLHVQSQPGDSLVGLLIDNLFIGPDSGVGISDVKTLSEISVFPNPSAGKIYVNAKDHSSVGYSIEVLNLTGETIVSEKSSELINFEINAQQLPEGIYFIRVKSENSISIEKISIVH